MPDGAPQQGDWFDQNAPPTSSANPAGTMPGPGATSPPVGANPTPTATGGTLDPTGITDPEQWRQAVNAFLAANGIPNTDNGQYWVDHWNQYGSKDPNYIADQLRGAVGRIKGGGGTLGGLGGGGFAQGGPFPGFTPPSYGDFLNSPGLKFGLDQGLKSVQQSAAAKGELQGGPTLKALTDYATNYGETQYNNVFNQALQTNQQNFGINQGNFSNLYNLGNWGIGAVNGATA